MAWFTCDGVSTYKINGEPRYLPGNCPLPMAQESQSGIRDATQSRDVGIVVIKPLTKGRVEKAVHH
jgi:hypothetical protein